MLASKNKIKIFLLFRVVYFHSMSQKTKSKRQKRRSQDGMAPSGGAGLIRFYQDESNGIKLSPVVTLVLSGGLIVVVLLAHAGVFDWIL
jgi:preprotein translocase subunit Sec61beta